MTSKHLPKYQTPNLRFCGYSGSGKTTIIESLVTALVPEWSISYFKHHAHALGMENQLKDSNRAFAAGASSAIVTDDSETLIRKHSGFDLIQISQMDKDCHLIFVEGWKFSPGPKVVVIDDKKQILQDFADGRLSDVIAFIGKDPSQQLPLPYFQRDQIAEIAAFITSWLNSQREGHHLRGLILAGGKSSRMKTDKSLLRYHAQPHAEFCFQLIAPHCQQTFISCRPEQLKGSEIDHLPQLHDRFAGFGPLGGILTAFESSPNSAWLVVACDLPLIDQISIDYLLRNRDRKVHATCFLDSESKLPEPLCSVYEPSIRPILFDYLQSGMHCPRKILINQKCRHLEPLVPRALTNANDPTEYQTILAEIQSGATL